jgi:hypothetical protein
MKTWTWVKIVLVTLAPGLAAAAPARIPLQTMQGNPKTALPTFRSDMVGLYELTHGPTGQALNFVAHGPNHTNYANYALLLRQGRPPLLGVEAKRLPYSREDHMSQMAYMFEKRENPGVAAPRDLAARLSYDVQRTWELTPTQARGFARVIAANWRLEPWRELSDAPAYRRFQSALRNSVSKPRP